MMIFLFFPRLVGRDADFIAAPSEIELDVFLFRGLVAAWSSVLPVCLSAVSGQDGSSSTAETRRWETLTQLLFSNYKFPSSSGVFLVGLQWYFCSSALCSFLFPLFFLFLAGCWEAK